MCKVADFGLSRETVDAVADRGGGGGGGFRGLQPPQKLRAIHTKCTFNTVLSMQTHRFTQQ